MNITGEIWANWTRCGKPPRRLHSGILPPCAEFAPAEKAICEPGSGGGVNPIDTRQSWLFTAPYCPECCCPVPAGCSCPVHRTPPGDGRLAICGAVAHLLPRG